MTFLTSGSSSTGTIDDNAYQVGPDGSIQSAIDDASADMAAKDDEDDEPDQQEFGDAQFKTVRLSTGIEYNPSSTIKVKPGVRLECNGARITPSGDFPAMSTYQMTRVVEPWINTNPVNGYSSPALRIGDPNSRKVESGSPSKVISPYLFGNQGEGVGLQFYGGGYPVSIQSVTDPTIHAYDTGIHFYADGAQLDGDGNWTNGNLVSGAQINACRIGVRLQSEGAAVSGNVIRGQVQTNPEISEWVTYIDDDPRDPDNTDFTDSSYVRRGNSFELFSWDITNINDNNPYYDSSDRRPPIHYVGRGKTYYNSYVDLNNIRGNEFIVNNCDVNPNTIGTINRTGAATRGATAFTVDARAFQPGDSQRTQYHPEGNN